MRLNCSESKLFLATTIAEAKKLGYTELDVILISADAYVDHPAFAAAIIGRYLKSLGLRVGIIPQPDWRNPEELQVCQKPRLFFGVTAGNLDSMVALYTAQRKIRSDDPYSENGLNSKRPYLPTIIYTNLLKNLYKGVPVIIGGIEASLRRLSHYDFYQNKLRPSILLDSKADLLVYGHGESPLKEIVSRLESGQTVQDLKNIRGTVVPVNQNDKNSLENMITLPSHEEVKNSKETFNKMLLTVTNNMNPYCASTLYQEVGTRGVLVNPPALPLTTKELDSIYELPFTRQPHPRYKQGIPALEVVRYSITSHRGCYGGCSFCSLYLHQGKFIQDRSPESIIKELNNLSKAKDKKINITDVGGPSANMYGTFCQNSKAKTKCKKRSCLFPTICKHLNYHSSHYRQLLERIKNHQQVSNVYINSGIRTDLALLNKDFMTDLIQFHTQGHLSVAPEHVVQEILTLMGKPHIQDFEQFMQQFYKLSAKINKKQYIIPYFMIGHPGATEATEKALICFIKNNKIKVKQVQEFYPTPMSLSTAMYYTELDPFTNKPIYVEKKLGVKKRLKEEITKEKWQ